MCVTRGNKEMGQDEHMTITNSEQSVCIKNILICVPKMNRSLTGLERHEGE